MIYNYYNLIKGKKYKINLKKDIKLNRKLKNVILFKNKLINSKKLKYNKDNYKSRKLKNYKIKKRFFKKRRFFFKIKKFFKKNKFDNFFFNYSSIKHKKNTKLYRSNKIKTKIKFIKLVGCHLKYNLNKYKNYKMKNVLLNKKYFLFYSFLKNIKNYKKYFLFSKMSNLNNILNYNDYNLNLITINNLIYNYNKLLYLVKKNSFTKLLQFNKTLDSNLINFDILKIISKIFNFKKYCSLRYKYIIYDLIKILKKDIKIKKLKKKRNIFLFSKIIERNHKFIKNSRIIKNYLNENSSFNNSKISYKNNFNNLNFFKKNNFLKKNLIDIIRIKNNIKLINKNIKSFEKNIVILLYNTNLFKSFNEVKSEIKSKNIKTIKKSVDILVIKLSYNLKNRLILRLLDNIKLKRNYLKKIPNYIEFDLDSFIIIFNFNHLSFYNRNNTIKNILLNKNNINIIKYLKNKSLKINKVYKNLLKF